MLETIARYLEGISDITTRRMVDLITKPIGDRLSSQTHVSGALRIHGGSASPKAQLNANYYGVAQGVLLTIASATDMPVLSGTVANGAFNVFCFFVNSAGTVSTVMGIAGATLGAVIFPVVPERNAMIGYVIINPTGTGNFVGNTTNLDDGTVVPNAVFVNTLGAFDPSILMS